MAHSLLIPGPGAEETIRVRENDDEGNAVKWWAFFLLLVLQPCRAPTFSAGLDVLLLSVEPDEQYNEMRGLRHVVVPSGSAAQGPRRSGASGSALRFAQRKA